MDLPTLLAEADLDGPTRAVVDDLVATKAVTRESGVVLVPEPIVRFVRDEFLAAEQRLEHETPVQDRGAARRAAEAFFRHAVSAP